MRSHLVYKSAQEDMGGGCFPGKSSHFSVREAEAWGTGLPWTQGLSVKGPATSRWLASLTDTHTQSSTFQHQHPLQK